MADAGGSSLQFRDQGTKTHGAHARTPTASSVLCDAPLLRAAKEGGMSAPSRSMAKELAAQLKAADDTVKRHGAHVTPRNHAVLAPPLQRGAAAPAPSCCFLGRQ